MNKTNSNQQPKPEPIFQKTLKETNKAFLIRVEKGKWSYELWVPRSIPASEIEKYLRRKISSIENSLKWDEVYKTDLGILIAYENKEFWVAKSSIEKLWNDRTKLLWFITKRHSESSEEIEPVEV